MHREELAAPRPFDQVQEHRAPCSVDMRHLLHHIGSTGENHGATNAVRSRLLMLDSSLCARAFLCGLAIYVRALRPLYILDGVCTICVRCVEAGPRML